MLYISNPKHIKYKKMKDIIKGIIEEDSKFYNITINELDIIIDFICYLYLKSMETYDDFYDFIKKIIIDGSDSAYVYMILSYILHICSKNKDSFLVN